MIQQRQNSFEMARAIGNYAQQVRAERCALTLCAVHLGGSVFSAQPAFMLTSYSGRRQQARQCDAAGWVSRPKARFSTADEENRQRP